jgi:hypothetical protein
MNGKVSKSQDGIISSYHSDLEFLPEPNEEWTRSEYREEFENSRIGAMKLSHYNIIRKQGKRGGSTVWRTDSECYERLQDYVSK